MSSWSPSLVGWGSGQAIPHVRRKGTRRTVASLLLTSQAPKVAVVQKRAEARDYLDIDALIRRGIDLPTALAAGTVVYGRSFDPIITLKALSFFDDLAGLYTFFWKQLSTTVEAVDGASLPELTPCIRRREEFTALAVEAFVCQRRNC